ncbi:hypothetical protein BKI52_00710 [marine bacterium AO1-C]|nr:hypothetical protein BKI52_00710 [marine bacterium AO1-C]
MDIKLITAIITFITCGLANTYAQYIPKSYRKSNTKLHTIKIKKGDEVLVKRSSLFCDTLIMEDESTLKIPYQAKSFTLYAKYCKIGKQCMISSRGKDGKKQQLPTNLGEPGSNAAHINLYLNIQELGYLTVDATGGNGGSGRLPGIYGAGGHVNLHYYSPLILKVKKHRRPTRSFRDNTVRKPPKGQPTITIKNKVGWMNSRRFDTYLRPPSYTPSHNGPILPVIRTDPMLTNSARVAEQKRRQRKDGNLKINRQAAFISPADVKIQ